MYVDRLFPIGMGNSQVQFSEAMFVIELLPVDYFLYIGAYTKMKASII